MFNDEKVQQNTNWLVLEVTAFLIFELTKVMINYLIKFKFYSLNRIQFDHQPRWENETMGWGSTGDRLSNLEIDFITKEDAELYCQRMGIF